MHSTDRNSRSERRSSTRRSARLSTENAGSDDEYDLAASAVPDGFRPSANNRPNVPSPTSPPSPMQPRIQLPNFPRSPPPVATSPLKGLADFNRPSSTSKPPRLHDSLTLRNDGLASSRVGQASSSSSSLQDDGLYPGSTQPSHPYQMYPQRTYSNATSSTGPSTETADGSQGPTHPYTLYSQNTTPPEDPTQHDIPVGFNGMGNGYRRQIGPDGEDAGDLIGPLGHMEELPPYTRYPQDPFQDKPENESENNTPPVVTVDVTRATTVGLSQSSPVQPIPGAGGIGLATRNPEFASTEDLAGLPHRSGSSIRSRSSLESYHEINGAARDFAEKPTPSKWQRRAKKKLWGVVPYWAICLLLSGIVIMGVVMGTVIGTIVSRHGGSKPKGDKQFDKDQQGSDSNVKYLERPPPGLPPLATGCFALPTMEKYQVPKACFKDSDQTPAWSCDMPFRWYSMNITEPFNTAGTCNYSLKLAPFDAKASKFIFGTQPPDIPDFKTMWLVTDLEEKNRGPAWFLQIKYNKTVMVREDQLTVPGKPNAKRGWGHSKEPFPFVDNSRFQRKGMAATEGDKPWICTWPNVLLQVFIYPNQTFTPPRPSAVPSPSMRSPFYHPTPTPTPDGPPDPKFKEPYPKLVKFVEKRPSNAGLYAPATCTQYRITNGGQDKVPVMQDGKPVTITIDEVIKNPKRTITQRSAESMSEDVSSFSSLESRDMDLTPCGCVSFSWSV